MHNSKTPNVDQQKAAHFKATCPFCLSVIDVYLDIKARPYWRCWRCEVRSFGTKTALETLTADGWIWTTERPLDALRGWLTRLADSLGLPIERPKKEDRGNVANP